MNSKDMQIVFETYKDLKEKKEPLTIKINLEQPTEQHAREAAIALVNGICRNNQKGMYGDINQSELEKLMADKINTWVPYINVSSVEISVNKKTR